MKVLVPASCPPPWAVLKCVFSDGKLDELPERSVQLKLVICNNAEPFIPPCIKTIATIMVSPLSYSLSTSTSRFEKHDDSRRGVMYPRAKPLLLSA